MGNLVGIFTSNGGVPKLPVNSAVVENNGIVGDACNNKKHHGGALEANCGPEKELPLRLAF